MPKLSAEEKQKEAKINNLANKVLSLARDQIVVNFRFMDISLAALKQVPINGLDGMSTDGNSVFFDPKWVLKEYEEEPKKIARTYLHLLLHLIFVHGFQYDKMDTQTWDLATDIAVENTILEMDFPAVQMNKDTEIAEKIKVIKKQIPNLTAEKVYRYLKVNELSESGKIEWYLLFHKDKHDEWHGKEKSKSEIEKWMKISERVKADLKSFTKGKTGTDTIETNLKEATKEKYDYGEILKRFTVMGEDMQINDDEFDYIYYTYGLENYGNMPLIEPLEYKDANKVREFVIAIDTSASCRGEIVQAFLRKTYSILKSSENFFHKVNIHIVQCDSQIQQDVKITNQQDFDEFCSRLTLKGFGSTDFRPVFQYIDQLKEQGEFEKLKGLIYFTDGYGIYPERMPDYDVIFAFLTEDDKMPVIPPWALKVVIEPEEMEKEIRR